MGEGLATDILLILLVAIISFLGWMAISINKATNNLSALRTDFENIRTLIAEINGNLKAVQVHDLLIAVLKTKVENLENDTKLIFEKLREYDRGSKNTLHRGQPR